jgi:hypothetical protein
MLAAVLLGASCAALHTGETIRIKQGAAEAPLDAFADPTRAEIIGDREWRGHTYTLKAYLHEDRRIWGATARIMEDLAVRVLGLDAAI